jgi:hypothetical protein
MTLAGLLKLAVGAVPSTTKLSLTGVASTAPALLALTANV